MNHAEQRVPSCSVIWSPDQVSVVSPHRSSSSSHSEQVQQGSPPWHVIKLRLKFVFLALQTHQQCGLGEGLLGSLSSQSAASVQMMSLPETRLKRLTHTHTHRHTQRAGTTSSSPQAWTRLENPSRPDIRTQVFRRFGDGADAQCLLDRNGKMPCSRLLSNAVSLVYLLTNE